MPEGGFPALQAADSSSTLSVSVRFSEETTEESLWKWTEKPATSPVGDADAHGTGLPLDKVQIRELEQSG